MTSSTTADRIEKRITLRAPRTRVWRALSESSQFGAWFGMKFEGPFEARPSTARSRPAGTTTCRSSSASNESSRSSYFRTAGTPTPSTPSTTTRRSR